MLVILLIGIVLVLAVPSTRYALTEKNLEKASRQLIGLERQLRADAVRTQIDHVLCLDVSRAAYWIITADMTAEKQDEIKKNAKQLPAGVALLDVVEANNAKKSMGEVKIRCGRDNVCSPAVIHLSHQDEKMTLVINPFLGVTEIYNRYMDLPIYGAGNFSSK
jgi:Tfp pilus assembly protein FimT